MEYLTSESLKMPPEASVIIPTYEDWQGLQLCLDCLARQTVALDRFEVIVANNNPSPQVPASLILPANARILHVPKPGSYAARNAALKEAQGDALFFTDSDCLPDKAWIESGLATLANLRPIDRIAGGVELFPNGDTWTWTELYDRAYSMRQARYVEVGWCATANLVTRRAAFDLVGPFSEDAFSGGDNDWGMRALALGSQISFSAATLIRHPARRGFSALGKKARRIAGQRYQRELWGQRKRRWLFSYLLPHGTSLSKVARDDTLTDIEKMKVMCVHYALSFIILVEVIRLRYLSSVPERG